MIKGQRGGIPQYKNIRMRLVYESGGAVYVFEMFIQYDCLNELYPGYGHHGPQGISTPSLLQVYSH